MLRKKVVVALLLEDICGLPGATSADAEDTPPEPDRQLRKARRRATFTVVFNWLALAILFYFRSSRGPWLMLGAAEESLFTLGVLAVAVHSGFRLAQLHTLRSVKRVLDNLEELTSGR
ncbi:MAG: hypothetical protein OEM62_08410 [Acidobacteriota bacterium]|nr:hypothetical protein [Acidobacteriota bacterium]